MYGSTPVPHSPAVAADGVPLKLNEYVTVTVYASKPWNWSHIKLVKDQRYKFTVASPEWNNGSRETTAAGYEDGLPTLTRRHQGHKLMALIGEIYGSDNDVTSYTGVGLLIGLGREYTATRTGILVTAANDCGLGASAAAPLCYADNSRVVTLTIKRIE